jgi:exodeoxyribonuclease VII small subunit
VTEKTAAGDSVGAANDSLGAADQSIGATPSYEQARDELTEVVRRLESGGLTLEESLALWERGEALADICQRWLDGAREKLDAAVQRRVGEQGTEG